jgi:hypothetical protein
VTPERVRLQKLLRAALVLQAAGLLGIIALTFPDWLDQRLHPYVPCGLCLDLRGLALDLSAIFLGPVALLLLILAWRWRGPRLWPLAIVALIDTAAIFLTADGTVAFLQNRTESIPPYASAPLLILLPALATLALGVNLLRPVRLRPLLAASTAGCMLLAAFFLFSAIRPVQQTIPGELSLPFSRTAVYEGRDLGCWDHVQGWVDEHTCLRAALLVYRGSGDPSKDQETINRILVAQERIQLADSKVVPLPLDTAVNKTYSRDVDPNNAGLCLLIIDQQTVVPPRPQLGRCGMVTDYADIHSHWPGDDAYAIGIIYYWERPDYVSDHSVTFLDAPVSALPGHIATLRVHADANTRCSIVVVDSTGSNVPGLDPKTTDAAGNVDWTWSVDRSTTTGRWPITVTCGAASGWTSWYVNVPVLSPTP